MTALSPETPFPFLPLRGLITLVCSVRCICFLGGTYRRGSGISGVHRGSASGGGGIANKDHMAQSAAVRLW